MITEAGKNHAVLFGQRQNLCPIRLARAIHHHALDADTLALSQQHHLVSTEAFVVQMIMSVVKFNVHGGAH